MNIPELLPIGSIVLLKNAEKRLMVTGVGQTEQTSGTDYDYLGVMYPEGSMGEGTQFLFNHTDIDRVDFRGFEDGERSRFLAMLQKYYASEKRKT